MCGIGMIIPKTTISTSTLDNLFKCAEKRGRDGFGYTLYTEGKLLTYKTVKPYSEVREKVLKQLEGKVEEDTVLLYICRAQPETEVDTSKRNMQPIVKNGIIVVHNGAVDNKTWKEYRVLGYETEIDTEAIINGYLVEGKNLVKFMENASGGYAFILLDTTSKKVYTVADFKPLSYANINNYGYFVHSTLECLNELYERNDKVADVKRKVEMQKSYTVREIDFITGEIKQYDYIPYFRYPVEVKPKDKEVVLVICSGGIDSSLTAYILHLLNYDVRLVHFEYGQKGEEAERLAVQKLSKLMGVPLYLVKERDYYKLLNSKSMLLDGEVEVSTGRFEDIKSTVAWVCVRNLLFFTKTLGIAESLILKEGIKKVWIAGGFAQLSEEGFYPDNSERFIESFMEVTKYGSLVGKKIGFLPVFKNVMKYEEWILGSCLRFPFEYTVSCDNPTVKNGEIYLCEECGSTRLSMFAAKMAGVKDPRKFYSTGKKDGLLELKSKKVKVHSPLDIVDRLVLPKEKKEILKRIVMEE